MYMTETIMLLYWGTCMHMHCNICKDEWSFYTEEAEDDGEQVTRGETPEKVITGL